MLNMSPHSELVMARLTAASQNESPRKVVFFDPLSAGLLEEATDPDIEVSVLNSKQIRQVLLHSWPTSADYSISADGKVISRLSKPEVPNRYVVGSDIG